MKNKVLVSLMFASVFVLGASPALADQCGDVSLNHPGSETVDPITFATTTIAALNNVACGNGSPENIVRPWGRNADVPHMKSGESASDEAGVSFICSAFTSTISGCLDITHTDYYRNQMRTTYQQLRTSGFLSQFPMFAGWANR